MVPYLKSAATQGVTSRPRMKSIVVTADMHITHTLRPGMREWEVSAAMEAVVTPPEATVRCSSLR